MACNKTRILQLIAVVFCLFLVFSLAPQNYTIVEDDNLNLSLHDQNSTWIESDVLDRADYSVYKSLGSYDGYNLFSLYEWDRNVGNTTNMVLIMDMDGNVIAKHALGEGGGAHFAAEFIDPNTVLVGSQQGAAIWHLENDTMDFLGFGGHHEYEYNPNSDTIFTFQRLGEVIGGTTYLFDTIMEYAMNGTLVWSWNVSDFISETWWCPYHDTWNGARDITHSNTIYYVADEDIIYYNSRNTNTFFKLNHTSKQVIWGLGEYGNFTLYDLQGNIRDELFYHAHAVEPVDDKTFIIFDNDYHNQTSSLNQKSRMLEITIDEDTMTANESWYYEAQSRYYSTGWGDADRLPNGNRLGAFGYPTTPVGGPSAALIEVTPDHEVVWQVNFQYLSNRLYGVYRMERFRFTPSLSSPEDIISENKTYSLSWDVWYNYRNKQDLPGNYTLYIDDVPEQYGTFTYYKYWKPSSISIDTGHLDIGLHNITLEVDDGYGNTKADSVSITVEPFHISRTGRTSIEKGQTTLLPTWSGFTSKMMFYNITLNGSLYEEMNWTGQDIILDPSLIDIGLHNVHFQLFNGSEIVFDDSFSLHVYPTEPPVITPFQPLELSIVWSDPLILSWNLSDASPYLWRLLVDGVQVNTSNWDNMTLTLEWNVPVYTDGFYNITLVAYDLAGQWAKSETNLTVNLPLYPHILSGPDDQVIAWGVEGISFEWETYNAETWILLRNGTQIGTGGVTSNVIDISITDWYGEGWLGGTYNLTLVVIKNSYESSHTFWLEIMTNPGDAYADSVVMERSESYLLGNNSLGPPDDKFAIIYLDYQNGYLTLDMGENEEVIDGTGDDLAIYASGGEYVVSVTNSLSDLFTYVGSGLGYQAFDLQTAEIDEARYVRVAYTIGEDVKLDAVEALNYNSPPLDTDSPLLIVNQDSYRVEKGTSVLLTWIAYDETPLKYDIYMNSQLVGTEIWNGSNIQYLFESTTVGMWNITIIAYDIFSNHAVSTIMVDVYSPNNFPVILIGGLMIGSVALTVVVIWIKKR